MLTEDLPRFPAIAEFFGTDGQPLQGPEGYRQAPGVPRPAPTPPPTPPAGLVLICEHASNLLPATCPALGGDLGISEETKISHAAWDIGALGLARALARHLAPMTGGALLLHAPLSRLTVDLNRAPDDPTAMPARSEIHRIPGNEGLTPVQRHNRLIALHTPFHARVEAAIATLAAQGLRPAVVTVHSFTPVFNGLRREVEFGVIHDEEPALSLNVLEAAEGSGLVTRLNEPYSAAGGVAYTLREHTRRRNLPGTMLEIRNDLIADEAAQEAMAGRLAAILRKALDKLWAQSLDQSPAQSPATSSASAGGPHV